MVRTAPLLVLLLSSIAIAAQSTSNSHRDSKAVSEHSAVSGMVSVWPTIVAGCPIYMHASQGLWDRTIRVREGESERVPDSFGQRIHLSLRDPHPARIVGAAVRVRGFDGTNRTLPTPADAEQSWNAVRTLHVRFAEQSEGGVSADLRIPGFTAVGIIQLITVSYSDGSVWRVTGPNACRVQPDPDMLITER